MTRPIKPSEVANEKIAGTPDEVFAVFNKLIADGMSGGSATVKQEDAVRLIAERLECESQEVFDRGWLNIESAYRAAGWKVTYDKPGYNETYQATFTFRKR